MRITIVSLATIALIPAAIACGGGSGSSTPTATARPATAAGSSTALAASTSVPPTSTAPGATSTTAPAATGTPAGPVVDPCTVRMSLEGIALVPGISFALDASVKWQLCNGGAAAGSSEKFLFHTTDGGHAWTLISRTTLGNPPVEAGVGALPNGNGVTVLLFQDAAKGWMGLGSPGPNFFRSTDGGVMWTAVPELPPAVPVTSITFATPMNGTVVTATGSWLTTDGGLHWTMAP